MIENYKNILENVNEIGDSIYKQTLKREFQERIKTTKTKIDTLYNLAFYDIDLVALNFNSLLLKYKEYRNLKKKTFLFTIKVKDYENYYYKTIEEQTAMVNRLKEVNKLFLDGVNDWLKDTKDFDVNRIQDRLNDAISKFLFRQNGRNPVIKSNVIIVD